MRVHASETVLERHRKDAKSRLEEQWPCDPQRLQQIANFTLEPMSATMVLRVLTAGNTVVTKYSTYRLGRPRDVRA